MNPIGQRTNATRSGATTHGTALSYDGLGQVIAYDDGNPAADRAYQYDSIGKCKKSANSLSLPTADNYTASALNQYTAVEAFTPTYDDDGNQKDAQIRPLASSSLVSCVFEWDAENRLTAVKSPAGEVLASYRYDAYSRLISRTSAINGQPSTVYYLYDLWNRIAEYQLQNSSFNLHTSYLWGLDLSGTMQGAGGVGGLLAVRHSPLPPGEGQGEGQSTVFYPCFDGNGNITEYLDATGVVAAHFEYAPFGNTVVNTDTAGLFPYRFSTKPQDPATGLLYYGYRWYDPLAGRWPSCDPIGELGGMNLYGFVFSNPIVYVDVQGEMAWALAFGVPGVGQVLAIATVGALIVDLGIRGENSVIGQAAQGIASAISGGAENAEDLARKTAEAARKAAEAAKRVARKAECHAIWAAYKATESGCGACNGSTPGAEAGIHCACWSAAVAGRSLYLSKKCDYYLDGSIAAGSRAKEATHKEELANKIKAMKKCCDRAFKCARDAMKELPEDFPYQPLAIVP